MKTLTEVIHQKKEPQTQLPSSPDLLQKSRAIMQKYGLRENFLTIFNPDKQREICINANLCFFGDAPTLSQINVTYGRHTAAMWLIPQLYNLSEYCGCRDKLKGKPLEECASVIASEFHWLKVTELMLFFHRFKSGRYGRFYGSVDPLVITTSLHEFLKERGLSYDRHEQEIQQAKDAESKKKAITWEEYCRKNGREVTPNPLSSLNSDGK